ncbi:MAG: lipopolysaccharide biosynthesis protein [Pirellulales bacterium]|nr:lipopolysaccharide biosynthesis protein [Pirellulales bacterium]
MSDVLDNPVSRRRRRLQADSLAASVVILLLVTMVQRSIGFGRGVLFCRWMSPEELGQWELSYSFLMLAAPLAVLGVPGSFGRYAEHFRQRGHLKTFLHRAAAWTGVCTAGAVLVIELFAPELSRLIFGSDQHVDAMRGIGLCLVTIIFYHTLTTVLTALRTYRVVSAMNFTQSLLFAVVSLALMWRRPEMMSVVYGYSAASFVAAAGGLVWAWPALIELERPGERLPHGEFWGKLLRLAFFVWVTNLLTHLFAIVDRYMLVHCAGMSPQQALDQIGHYHSSRIIPLLMVSVAEMLSGLVMPHLSHDWEIGRRREVSSRLNLAVKLTALGMLAFGACVLAAGPLLFHVVLQGRYDVGLRVLPWSVAACVFYSLYLVGQNYLWCAEKNWLQTAPLALGLLVNLLFNLLLLPHYGLYGCVVSSTLAAAACFASVMGLNRRHGMAVDRGTWLIGAAPLALGFGATAATTAACIAAALCIATEAVLTGAERSDLKALAGNVADRVLPVLRRRRLSAGS